jgi:hypothetical protein
MLFYFQEIEILKHIQIVFNIILLSKEKSQK